MSWQKSVTAGVLGGSMVLGGLGYGATRVPDKGECQVLRDHYPDAACTAGALSGNVTQDNLKSTACRVGGYTSSVRPPSGYTNRLKRHLMTSYDLDGTPREYELDHFIPLALGGEPRGTDNLWPQAYEPVPGAHEKDRLEARLRRLVCAEKMTLTEAQELIGTDWVAAWRKYVNGEP